MLSVTVAPSGEMVILIPEPRAEMTYDVESHEWQPLPVKHTRKQRLLKVLKALIMSGF